MSDRKYWRKRSVKLGLLSERKAQRTARAVLDAYDKVLTTVQGRIERIFARFVRNNDSLNAEKARQLLSVRETQKYRQELLVLYHSTTDKALRDELRAMLEAPAYANRISRLEALRDIVRADCRQLGSAGTGVGRQRAGRRPPRRRTPGRCSTSSRARGAADVSRRWRTSKFAPSWGKKERRQLFRDHLE